MKYEEITYKIIACAMEVRTGIFRMGRILEENWIASYFG